MSVYIRAAASEQSITSRSLVYNPPRQSLYSEDGGITRFQSCPPLVEVHRDHTVKRVRVPGSTRIY